MAQKKIRVYYNGSTTEVISAPSSKDVLLQLLKTSVIPSLYPLVTVDAKPSFSTNNEDDAKKVKKFLTKSKTACILMMNPFPFGAPAVEVGTQAPMTFLYRLVNVYVKQMFPNIPRLRLILQDGSSLLALQVPSLRRQCEAVNVQVLKAKLRAFIHTCGALSSGMSEAVKKEILIPGQSLFANGLAYVAFLNGTIWNVSMARRWTTSERLKIRVCLAKRAFLSGVSGRSKIVCYSRNRSSYFPDVSSTGPTEIIKVGMGSYEKLFPMVILDTSTFKFSDHVTSRLSDQPELSSDVYERIVHELHASMIVKVSGTELTYKTCHVSVISLRLDNWLLLDSTSAYINFQEYTCVAVGHLKLTSSGVWVLKLTTGVTGYKKSQIKTAMTTEQSTIITLAHPLKGGVKRHVATPIIVSNAASLETKLRLKKLSASILASDPSTGIPRCRGLVTHSSISRIPISLYDQKQLIEVFNMYSQTLSKITNLDGVIDILTKGSFEDDGGRRVFMDQIYAGVDYISPQAAIGKLILDTVNADPRMTEPASGAQISKKLCELLYLQPQLSFHIKEQQVIVKQQTYNVTHMTLAPFNGRFGYDRRHLGTKALSVTEYIGGLPTRLYEVPTTQDYMEFTSVYVPFSSDAELREIILSFQSNLGGVSVTPDKVLIDTPGIQAAIELARKKHRSIYLKTCVAQYIIAVYAKSLTVGGIRVFCVKNGASAVTSYAKTYRYDGRQEGVFAPFSRVPGSGFDYERFRSHFVYVR